MEPTQYSKKRWLHSGGYICAAIAICLTIIWLPLTTWQLHFDVAYRIPTALLFLSCILLFGEIKKYSLKAPLTIYCCLAVYMVINGLVMGSAKLYDKGGEWAIIINTINPVLLMLIISTLAQKDWNGTTKILIFATITYCILSLLNSSIDTSHEYNRLNSEINANCMALVGAICYGLIIMTSMTANKKWIQRLLCIIPLILIIRTGSRMALGMIIIITILAILGYSSQNKTKQIIIKVFSIIIFASVCYWILGNTMIGERMIGTPEQGEQFSSLYTNTIFDYFGDRGFQYYYSWPLFLEHPFFGIGFHQWIIHFDHVCHSEYMVQYLECGLVSFIPYMFFLYLLLRNLLRSRRQMQGNQKNVGTILLSLMIAQLFANTVLWSYDRYEVFIVYALSFAYAQSILGNTKVKLY